MERKKMKLIKSDDEASKLPKTSAIQAIDSTYQLQPRIDLNEPPLSPVLPGLDPLNQPGSSSDAGCNRPASLTHHTCDPGVSQQSNVLSRSKQVQQNTLPQYRNNQEQPTQPSIIQYSNSELWDLVEKIERKSKMLQSIADDLKAQGLSLESDALALKQLLHPYITVLSATDTERPGSTGVVGFLQTTTSGNAFALLARGVESGKIEVAIGNSKVPFDLPAKRAESGPSSTSEYITANYQSNRQLSMDAKEEMSTTDTDYRNSFI